MANNSTAKDFAAFLYLRSAGGQHKLRALPIKRFWLSADPQEARVREKFSIIIDGPRINIMNIWSQQPEVEVRIQSESFSISVRGIPTCVGPGYGGTQIDCVMKEEFERIYKLIDCEGGHGSGEQSNG